MLRDARQALPQWVSLLLLCGGVLLAAGPVGARPPAVPAGASRAEVIQLLGWPNGQSKAGAREILNYAQGQVVLEEGRVTRVDFSPKISWQPPKAAPLPASATSARTQQARQAWGSEFEPAKRDALQLMRPILVLFTGPVSPVRTPRFFEDVALHPDFVRAFHDEFVLLRVESGTHAELRAVCEVVQYPTIVFLNPSGEILGRSESFPIPTSTARARIIASVREAWAATGGSHSQAVASPGSGSRSTLGWVGSAWTLIITGVGAGIAIMLLLLWLLWRKRSVPQPALPDIHNRISDAAMGLPALADVQGWPQKKVCALAAGLADAEGYLVDTYKLGDNADLELRRPGDKRPAILVLAVGAAEGELPLARLRDLTTEMEAFKVGEGWVVAPLGFGADAVAYGQKHQLTLLNAEAMLQRLRDMPPLSLPALLAQVAAGQTQKR